VGNRTHTDVMMMIMIMTHRMIMIMLMIIIMMAMKDDTRGENSVAIYSCCEVASYSS
jgi:hypothetical protein